MMGKGCKIIHQDCDPTLAEDKSLPYNTFLIEYTVEGLTKFDIASGNGQVDIFDDYWDKYNKDFVTMTQTEGRVNPKMWNPPKKK
tara:strand:+ start:2363 stop:2617 length:255 start_codon:yes stop_codon:yes gene_type:complete